MQKQLLDQFSPFLLMGVMLLLVVGAAHYVWSIFNPTADFSAEDPQAIAKYKDWIQNNDMPFVGGKIKPDQLPLVYGKVIEYDVKNGDLKSARSLTADAINKKLDTPLLERVQLPEARELIGQVQNGARKVELLKQIVASLEKGQGKQVDAELAGWCDQFGKTPFNPSACPEQAEDIARLYKSSPLLQRDQSAAVKKVAEEIEKSCLPVPQPAGK